MLDDKEGKSEINQLDIDAAEFRRLEVINSNITDNPSHQAEMEILERKERKQRLILRQLSFAVLMWAIIIMSAFLWYISARFEHYITYYFDYFNSRPSWIPAVMQTPPPPTPGTWLVALFVAPIASITIITVTFLTVMRAAPHKENNTDNDDDRLNSLIEKAVEKIAEKYAENQIGN